MYPTIAQICPLEHKNFLGCKTYAEGDPTSMMGSLAYDNAINAPDAAVWPHLEERGWVGKYTIAEAEVFLSEN